MFQYEVTGLKSIITSQLIEHVGPIAVVLVSEAVESLSLNEEEKLSAPHIIAILRQIHSQLPFSIDKSKIMRKIRDEILANRI